MGGFGGVLFEAGEKAAGKLISSPEVREGAITVADHIFGMDSTLTGKSGAAIRNFLHNEFEPTYSQHLSEHVKAAQAAGSTAQPMDVDAKAHNSARAITAGNNDQVLAHYIKAVEQEHGQNKAQAVVDHLGIYFHEKKYPQGGGGTTSKLVSNLQKTKATKDLPFTPSPYEPPSVLERGFGAATTSALAYKAALAHLSTPVNMLISQSLPSFGRAIATMMGHDYAATKASMIASDSIGHVLAEEYAQAYKFRNGIIAKYAPGSIGEFVHKNWLVPGLSALRQRTAIAAAYQGEIVAHEAAEQLSRGNTRAAEADLRYLGIDPTEVRANNGKLTPEHVRNARFHNANKSVFLESRGSRARLATSTPLGRMVMAFHNYGARQGNFILQAMKKEMLDKRDPMAFVKTLVALGVIAPNVGNFTYSLEQGARTGDPKKAFEDFKNREKGLYSGHFIAENLEAFSHIAGFGIATSYARAGLRNRLANAMLGPLFGAATELGQDVLKTGYGLTQTEETKHAQKMSTRERQLMRDVLHDVPSLGIGSIIANKYVPTTAQIRADKPRTIKQIKAARARARKRR